MSILKWLLKPHTRPETIQKPVVPDRLKEQHIQDEITVSLVYNIQQLEQMLGESDDFTVRRFHVYGRFEAAVIYFSSLIDKDLLNINVLKPMMTLPHQFEGKGIELRGLSSFVLNDSLCHCQALSENRLTVVLEALLGGESVILIDGLSEAFLIETRNVDKRGIDQPATEQVIRGPREGFIEQLITNIGLIRYRLQSPDFRVNTMKIGRVTRSTVAVCYIKGIAEPALVEEVNNRLSSIDVDGILDTGYLEQYIEDNHLTPFPLVQNTERPDKVVANLLEGRVAIMVDGSPFALIVPTIFNQFYQVTEDYNERFLLVSFIRLARLIALIFSLITPSLYVAVISFNPELIPTKFAVAVAGGRAGVPFPSIVEVLVMEISMEVLREATVRLPQQVGGALSIVGVLVIGQAAVSAGFANPITVVVIALTTIGSFATPAYNAALALRLLRFPLLLLAGTFGLYGVMIGLIVIANHLLSLKSFGVPYMSPLVPGNFQAMKDTVFRSPLWWMRKRPSMFHPPNRTRVSSETVQHTVSDPSTNTLDPLKVGNTKSSLHSSPQDE